jgi:hypothetical protein
MKIARPYAPVLVAAGLFVVTAAMCGGMAALVMGSQRLSLALRMTTAQTPYLFASPPEVVRRRFELLRRQNDERNLRMCEAMARAERLYRQDGAW